MKVVVCYKNVPNADEIEVTKNRTLDFSNAAWELGQYDLNAIEAAMTVAASQPDSQVLALTAAGDVIENSKLKKAVLSRGPAKMIGVKDPKLDTADAYAVAQTLAAAIRRIGDVDLVVFGEGSGDAYAQQTGILTGALLGWNTVNAVQAMELTDDKLHLTRSGPDKSEKLEVALPAAICVTGDINQPRIPSLKDIMGAGKKPAEVLTLLDLGVEAESQVETVSVLAPDQAERKQILFEKPTDEQLAEIAQIIRNVR